jgi:stress-induced morphogen
VRKTCAFSVCPPITHCVFQRCTQRLEHTRTNSVSLSRPAGGCGAQYAVFVESEKFRGLNLVQQQRLVNNALKVP